MAAFDQLKRASFAGLTFPVSEVTVKGGIREHIHEYPHSDGGEVEKLGRKLYTVTMKASFQNTFLSEEWADLWPGRLSKLFKLFEQSKTEALHIPTVGTIQAYCPEWSKTMSAGVRSGEAVDLMFREDKAGAFLVNALLKVTGGTLRSRMAQVFLEMDKFDPKPNIFDQIQDASNGLLGLLDGVELYGNLVAAKIHGLASLIKSADETLDLLNDPVNHEMLDALHALWEAVRDLARDAQQAGPSLVTWTVPSEMSVGDISAALYGDATRGGDILQLNALRDAFAVPAGTTIRYYEAA